jgi:hypothetical protein
MQTPPGFLQIENNGLQHTNGATHVALPHGSAGTHAATPPWFTHCVPALQRTTAQGSLGTHTATPPLSMHCVPVMHKTAAQGLVLVTQMPPQSAPPFFGSQSSFGLSTQVCPSGQGIPAIPPQNAGSGAVTQMPPQSAPPFCGSQSSFGLSTHS